MTLELKVTFKDIIITIICVIWSTWWISTEIDNHQELQLEQFNNLKIDIENIIDTKIEELSSDN